MAASWIFKKLPAVGRLPPDQVAKFDAQCSKVGAGGCSKETSTNDKSGGGGGMFETVLLSSGHASSEAPQPARHSAPARAKRPGGVYSAVVAPFQGGTWPHLDLETSGWWADTAKCGFRAMAPDQFETCGFHIWLLYSLSFLALCG